MSRPQYPEKAPGTFRISQSSLETLLRCGLRYQYEQEIPHRRATVKMLVGSGVHGGAELDNRSKIASGEGVTVSELVERSVSEYEEEAATCEIPASVPEIADGKDDTAAAARTYALKVSALMTNVICAEEPIVASIAGEFEICGTPDVIVPHALGDLKVGRVLKQHDADRSRQLGIGGLLHLGRFGKFPERLWIDSLSRGARGWTAERLYTGRSKEQYLSLIAILKMARKVVESGSFLPAPVGAWWCAQAQCPFWNQCPAGAGSSRGGNNANTSD